MYIKKVRAGEIPDSLGFVKLLDDLAAQDKLAKAQLDAEWIEAAEATLAKNRSTVAVISTINMRGDRNYMAKLRELGYQVEEPPSAQ